MKPWEAVWLTPFQALQLVVSLRLNDEAAEALVDYSARSWLALHYRNRRDAEERKQPIAAGEAFRAAEVDLQSWCGRGWVKGFGIWNDGAQVRRENLKDWWTSARKLGFEQSTLSGAPVLRDVQLSGDDVRRLAITVGDAGPDTTPAALPIASRPATMAADQASPAQARRILEQIRLGVDVPPTDEEDEAAVLRAHPDTPRAVWRKARKDLSPPGGYKSGPHGRRKPRT